MTVHFYVPGGNTGEPGPAGGPIPPGGSPGQYPTPDGAGGYTWADPPSGGGGGGGELQIYQNLDGTWPARTTVTSDRTIEVVWVGTLPGPTIGTASSNAVARLDWLRATPSIPTA